MKTIIYYSQHCVPPTSLLQMYLFEHRIFSLKVANRKNVIPMHFLQDQAEHVTEIVAAAVKNKITRARLLLELRTRLLEGLALQTDGTNADQLRGNMNKQYPQPRFRVKSDGKHTCLIPEANGMRGSNSIWLHAVDTPVYVKTASAKAMLGVCLRTHGRFGKLKE